MRHSFLSLQFDILLLLLLRLATQSYGQLVWGNLDPEKFACRIGFYEPEGMATDKQFLEVSPDGEGLCPAQAPGCCLKLSSFENTDQLQKHLGSYRLIPLKERSCECQFFKESDSCDTNTPNFKDGWEGNGPNDSMRVSPKLSDIANGIKSFKCNWSNSASPPQGTNPDPTAKYPPPGSNKKCGILNMQVKGCDGFTPPPLTRWETKPTPPP
ncbi:hypothetical protein Dda_8250 [Drechslerella dactyloides]|uniref:Uncharacterized protein n=1 Tax=Drechslerella dactyloides TaxID=74499 RepID=A0AAD6IS29_DREDA|nr:hypothetical protein Dda_8250 [Drechslerella dactyloides]